MKVEAPERIWIESECDKEKENAVIEQVEQVFWYFTRYFMWVFVFLMAIAGAFFMFKKTYFSPLKVIERIKRTRKHGRLV